MIIPRPMSTAQLVTLLRDVADRVERGDSFGGSITYDAMDPNLPADADFGVAATYRIGNTGGQGGMRIVGEVVDT